MKTKLLFIAVSCLFCLALPLLSGCGNVDRVARYHKLAEQGDAEAQFRLGDLYHSGMDVPQDATEAAKWFRKAAEQGHAEAQLTLGMLYLYGRGLPEDKEEAIEWIRKSAEGGYDVAQMRLADRYYNGEGVAEDKSEAVKWYRIVAEQQGVVQADAMFMLGLCYHEGAGVPKDTAEAIRWLRKAEEAFSKQTTRPAGDNPATDFLRDIEET